MGADSLRGDSILQGVGALNNEAGGISSGVAPIFESTGARVKDVSASFHGAGSLFKWVRSIFY